MGAQKFVAGTADPARSASKWLANTRDSDSTADPWHTLYHFRYSCEGYGRLYELAPTLDMASRIQVSPPSEYHASVLETWALSTGRSLSSLCASLIDQALTDALERGIVPKHVLETVEPLFEQEREFARLTAELAVLKSRNSGFLSQKAKIHLVKAEIEEERSRREKGDTAKKKAVDE